MLTVGSLFSGIGGFDLGLERAGMRVVWQSEIDPYASAVLRKHWPDVPNLGDIRNITASAPRVDVICGGFPCQDISNAGKRAGIDGERSGLWSEYARVIGELRPRYVLVENVSALLGRGLERVLGDLAALGFDAEWHCIPAAYVGAPHIRDRVFIFAYANDGQRIRADGQLQAGRDAADSRLPLLADTIRDERAQQRIAQRVGRLGSSQEDDRDDYAGGTEWATEPDVGRVAHGVPSRVDRLRCLGNAIVPQVAEVIGRAIMGVTKRRRG